MSPAARWRRPAIALGTVIAADIRHGEPLSYHRRVFGTHIARQAGT
jgi:hypothetical protein